MSTTAALHARRLPHPAADLESGAQPADVELFRELASAEGAQRERLQTELVSRYAGLVRAIAGRYANPGVEVAELRQVGYLGLVLAIQRFDPERGVDFVSFARPTVTGEIRRYFRDKRRWVRLPRRVQETKAQLNAATEALSHRLGRSPTVPELAEHMHLGPEVVLEALTVDDAFVALSLDAPMGGDEADAWTLGDSLGDHDHRFELIVECQALKPLLEDLSERERHILQLRFGEDLTQAEIGQRLGYSQMHISRILAQTFAKLRAGLHAE
ncbi:MAG: SigB/SigF/SigG family RNA polymerase sigma factor [Sporichthyaceae bacterium]